MAQVLRPLRATFSDSKDSNLIIGLNESDDAAVYAVSSDLAIIQTIDFFPPVVDDPFLYGGISATNALSDIYAMGGDVKFALNVATFPDDISEEILSEIFRGGAEKVKEAGGIIVGGHTIIDREPKYGLSVTGFVHPEKIFRTKGARLGDVLLLTKPIGTGIALTAKQQDMYDADEVIRSMLLLNKDAAALARIYDVSAMTDVTGFGLAGHCLEMAQSSDVKLIVNSTSVPVFPNVLDLISEGIVTGGGMRNRNQLGEGIHNLDDFSGENGAKILDLFFDPQTSGGLLIAVSENDAEKLRLEIEAINGECWRIGYISKENIESGAGSMEII